MQLLAMMRQLRDRLPQAVLLVAGDGPEKSALADEIAATGLNDHVRLLGTRRGGAESAGNHREDGPDAVPAGGLRCVRGRRIAAAVRGGGGERWLRRTLGN